ncbi:MAG TPA: hypothetical protein VFP69_01780 [Streptomyces sp.]|nr:hypothetical protein [Streptomyces sp.]
MSENTAAAGDLASQYVARVTGDLERNVREQERVGADIAALRERLGTLQQDHAVLLSMQQVLSAAPAPPRSVPAAATSAPSATVPAPRSESAPGRARKGARAARSVIAPLTPPKRRPAGKAGQPAAGGASPASAPPGTANVAAPAAPTLVELIRAQLTEPGEPRSAADVAAVLERAHPGRPFKTTVVRNTLEALVARGQAGRSKQGGSVFYTAPGAARAEQEAGAAPSA